MLRLRSGVESMSIFDGCRACVGRGKRAWPTKRAERPGRPVRGPVSLFQGSLLGCPVTRLLLRAARYQTYPFPTYPTSPKGRAGMQQKHAQPSLGFLAENYIFPKIFRPPEYQICLSTSGQGAASLLQRGRKLLPSDS